MRDMKQINHPSRFYMSTTQQGVSSCLLIDKPLVSSQIQYSETVAEVKITRRKRISKASKGGLFMKKPKSMVDIMMTPMSHAEAEALRKQLIAFFNDEEAQEELSEWNVTLGDGLGLNAT